jgi:flagellar basal-body rod modification protein FlgD
MVDNISSTNNSNVQYATKSNSEMDKDAFLKLMIAQLQNQDPLEPLDGTDYSAQLAQFSSLEQMQNINETLNMSLDANYLLTQSITNTMTAGLIGKEAKIAGDTVKFEGQEKTIIGYELPAPADSIVVNVYDSNGAKVKSFKDLDTDAGQYKLDWDFTDDMGNKVSVGDYRIEIEAKTRGLQPMEVAQYFVGIIDGVRYSSSGTSIVINNLEYQVSDVFEIVQANSAVEVEVEEETENNTQAETDKEIDYFIEDRILGHRIKG